MYPSSPIYMNVTMPISVAISVAEPSATPTRRPAIRYPSMFSTYLRARRPMNTDAAR